MIFRRGFKQHNFFEKKCIFLKITLDIWLQSAYIIVMREKQFSFELEKDFAMMNVTKEMSQRISDNLREEWLAKGNKITVCKASKKRVKTFGSKGVRHNSGAKTNTLRNAGYAKAN